MNRIVTLFAVALFCSACPGPGANVDPPFDCSWHSGMSVEEMEACYGLPCSAKSSGQGVTYTYCPVDGVCTPQCPKEMTVGTKDGLATWMAQCPEQGCEPPAIP